MSANPHKGEVMVEMNGQNHLCKLTLGALAQLESDLQSKGLLDLVTRFETQEFSSRDIIFVLAAGLRGGGWQGDVTDVQHSDICGGPIGAAQAAAKLLHLAFCGANSDAGA